MARVDSLSQHRSTHHIVQNLQPQPSADLDEVVRRFVNHKLNDWASLPLLDAQARLIRKLPKLTPALQQALPQREITAAQVASSLQRAIERLHAVPSAYKTPTAWMNAFLGRHPEWEARLLQHAQTLPNAAPAPATLAAYRQQLVTRLNVPPTAAAATTAGEARGPSLAQCFAVHVQASEQAWQDIARFTSASSAQARTTALLQILGLGKKAQQARQKAAKTAEQARQGSVLAPRTLATAFQLRQQLAHAQDTASALLCGDAFWFALGRDPQGTAVDSQRLARMQTYLAGVSAALADVPGVNVVRPHIDGAQLASKILDPAKPENLDRIAWVQEKLHTVLRTLPLAVVQGGGFGKMCGVMLAAAVARTAFMATRTPLQGEALDAAMFRNLQVGLYFAVAYPLDDLLDTCADLGAPRSAAVLALAEQIEAALWCGSTALPDLPKVPEAALVRESFAALHGLFGAQAPQLLQTLALMLRGQRHDAQVMRSPDAAPKPEQGYIAGAIKNAVTGQALAQILGDTQARGAHAAHWALLGQLLDDLRDLDQDSRTGNATVFTEYLRNPAGLAHPLAQLLNVVLYLDHSAGHTESVRTFLGVHLQRALQRLGASNHIQLLQSLAQDPQAPHAGVLAQLRSIVQSAPTTPGIERQMTHWVRQAATAWSRTHRSLAAYRRDAEPLIQRLLHEPLPELRAALPLAIGRRYALTAPQAKHLRPLLVMMTADGLGLDVNSLCPLYRGVEKLHTASLIFDDLPAQDNAPARRGRHTLHTAAGCAQADLDAQALTPVDAQTYQVPAATAEARAQLTALALVGDVVQEVAQLADSYGDRATVEVIQYIGRAMGELSDGQIMDLLTPARPREAVDLAYLELLAELKTGRALEICIRSVGMLAQVKPTQLAQLTRLANRLGVLYQIKDDLLDVEGDSSLTGKEAGIDARNGNKTFVTVLGVEGAHQRLAEVSQEIDASLEDLAAGTMQVDLLRELQTYMTQRKQ